jgi:hypothetical protein
MIYSVQYFLRSIISVGEECCNIILSQARPVEIFSQKERTNQSGHILMLLMEICICKLQLHTMHGLKIMMALDGAACPEEMDARAAA